MLPGMNATVEIYADTRRVGRCRNCDEPILWAQVVASGRWMPFNGREPVALRTRHDRSRRQVEALDLADCHFKSCGKR